MPRAVRRRMKVAVTLVGEAQKLLGQRQVPETGMLALAPAFLDVAEDLAGDIASPDAQRAREIAAAVKTCISSQGTEGLRGDVSGVDAITDETSRSICRRQLGVIDRVHLVAAVVQGVEEGLRVLLRSGIASGHARDGPSSRDLTDAPVRPTAKENQVTADGSRAHARPSGELNLEIKRRSAAEPTRSTPMTPDYDDP